MGGMGECEGEQTHVLISAGVLQERKGWIADIYIGERSAIHIYIPVSAFFKAQGLPHIQHLRPAPL